MSFDIPIKIDPGNSATQVDRVTSSLHKAEDEGERARKKMIEAERAFASLGKAVHYSATVLTTKATTAFGELGRAIEMEARMMERATDRSRDFGLQVSALQRLHDTGRISAEQYIHTLEKMGGLRAPEMGNPIANQRAQTQKAVDLIGFGDAKPSSIKQPAISGAQMAALGGLAAGAAVAVQQFAAMDDRWTELTNTALKFTDAGRNVTMVLEDQTRLANDLHMGLEQTIGAYDGVRDATDDLNLTYEQQIRLTKTLAEAATLGGKSAESASAAIYNLKVAFDSGMDAGGALATLFKQFPDIASQMSASLGMSTGQIIAAARKGQIGFHDLTRSMITATDEIDKKFGQRAVTWGRNWEQVKDALSKPIDVVGTVNAFMNVDMAIGRVVQQAQQLSAQWVALEAERKKLAQAQIAGWEATRADGNVIGDLEAAAKRAGIAFLDLTKFSRDQAQAVSDARRDLLALNAAYEAGGRQAVPDYIEKKRELLDVIHGVTATMRSEREELRKYNEEIQRLNSIRPRNVLGTFEQERFTPAFPTINDPTKGLSTETALGAVTAQTYAEQAQVMLDAQADAIMSANGKVIEVADKQKEAALEVRDAWAQGLGSIAADLVNMAAAGEISVDRLASSFAKLALQIAAMQIGGPWGAALGSFAGGIGGFATGGSVQVPGDTGQFVIPHAATGWDGRVGGSGGTDSKLFMARVTPGEFVHINTPQQEARQQTAAAGAPVHVTVVAQNNERDVIEAGDTYGAQRVFVRNQRRYGKRAR